MQVIIIIGLIILAIVLLVIIIRHFMTKSRVVSAFKNGNVIVCGRKGFGKDVLFNAVIKWRKEPYHANISYGYRYRHIELAELELGNNTYNDFVRGTVRQCKKDTTLENSDVYISDGGVYLPSQVDYLLHKTYPSMPITYALNRHLFNNGIHVNAQRIERIWKALREQADYFVLLRKRCLKLPFFIVLFTTEYTRYESARQELAPLSSRLFNKYSKAEKDKYNALHGFVKNGLLIVPKRYLKYDSRAFHEVIYGEKAPKKEKLWQKIINFLTSKKSRKR